LLLQHGISEIGRYRENDKPMESLESYSRAVETLSSTLEKEKSSALALQFLRITLKCRAHLLSPRFGRHEEALADIQRAVRLEDKSAANALHIVRACILARQGKHAEAVAALKSLLTPEYSSDDQYNAVCLYALAAAAHRDAELQESERRKLSQEYLDQAMSFLDRARKASHFQTLPNRHDVRTNPDLESLRSREDFKKLVTELEEMSKPRDK
jgi:tetratricopeptide (TPR) repeat protein